VDVAGMGEAGAVALAMGGIEPGGGSLAVPSSGVAEPSSRAEIWVVAATHESQHETVSALTERHALHRRDRVQLLNITELF